MQTVISLLLNFKRNTETQPRKANEWGGDISTLGEGQGSQINVWQLLSRCAGIPLPLLGLTVHLSTLPRRNWQCGSKARLGKLVALWMSFRKVVTFLSAIGLPVSHVMVWRDTGACEDTGEVSSPLWAIETDSWTTGRTAGERTPLVRHVTCWSGTKSKNLPVSGYLLWFVPTICPPEHPPYFNSSQAKTKDTLNTSSRL